MTIGARTYGSVEGIEKLIGDIVSSRKFTTATVPTLAQVEEELDAAAADLNRELDAAGYYVPVDPDEYPIAWEFLASANNYGAAAVLLATIPGQSYTPDDEVDPGSVDRGQTYNQKFKAALKAIMEFRIRAAMRKRRLSNIFTGAQEDSNGNEKGPLFTRGMDEYPGSTLGNTDSDSES